MIHNIVYDTGRSRCEVKHVYFGYIRPSSWFTYVSQCALFRLEHEVDQRNRFQTVTIAI